MMILYHFPQTMDHAFRPEYDRIKWVNNEDQFKPGAKAKPAIRWLMPACANSM